MMVMVMQPPAAAAALDPLARMQNYTLGPMAPSPRCAAHDRRRQALARWRRAEAATPCNGYQQRHMPGRFIGGQRSDLFGGKNMVNYKANGPPFGSVGKPLSSAVNVRPRRRGF